MGRKKKKTIDETIIYLINKMLEPYRVDFEYVKANPQIEGKLWCAYYTWTEEEETAFRKFAIDTLRKELKWSKRLAEREYSWFNLIWGLKVANSGSETLPNKETNNE